MQGALIVAIDPESPLATFCQLNDVIAKINEQSIQSAEEAVKLINERAEHDRMIVSLDRRGDERDGTLHDPGALMSSAPLFLAVERLAAGESLSAARVPGGGRRDPGQSGARGRRPGPS